MGSQVSLSISPTVTVLMAVHNAEPFLREAVDSILGQTFGNFELLVVDDGSTDGTRKILAGYPDVRLRVIGLPENRGLVEALNAGIREARGALIARMDGDDVAEPARLEEQVAFMKSYPQVVLLGTSLMYVDAGGRVFGDVRMRTDNRTLQELLPTANQFCHPSVVMRADVVRSIGGYRELAGRAAQDYDLWLRLAERGEIANLSDLLLRYRVHENQISVSKLANQRRAANTYRALALQRRSGAEEDLEAAQRSSLWSDAEMRRAMRSDYLTWASLYAAMGRKAMAMALLVKAFRAAPTDAGTWTALRRHLAQELRRSHVRMGKALRWYRTRFSQSMHFPSDR